MQNFTKKVASLCGLVKKVKKVKVFAKLLPIYFVLGVITPFFDIKWRPDATSIQQTAS